MHRVAFKQRDEQVGRQQLRTGELYDGALYELRLYDSFLFSLQLYSGPHLHFDARNLQPATQYAFRVQALNSAGASPFSVTSSCTTPPSVPSVVPSLRASATAVSVHLSWREPECHGSAIVAYNIDLGEAALVTTGGNSLSWTIDNLLPETNYK